MGGEEIVRKREEEEIYSWVCGAEGRLLGVFLRLCKYFRVMDD